MVRSYTNQQQQETLLSKLEAITNTSFIDLKDLKPPKGKASTKGRSTKRNMILSEILDKESNKKAKTLFGKGALETW